MEQNGCGPILGHCQAFALGLRKTANNLSQDGRPPDSRVEPGTF